MNIVVFCEAQGDTGLELLGKARRIAPEARLTALYEDEAAPLARFQAAGADEALCMGLCLRITLPII